MNEEPIQPEVRDEPDRGPWGPWVSLAFTAGIFLVFAVATAVAVVLPFGVARAAAGDASIEEIAATLEHDGLVLSLSFLVGTPLVLVLSVGVVLLRGGLSWKEYLGLRRPSRQELLLWTAGALVFVAAYDLLTWSVGRPIVPAFVRDAWATAGFLPLLWFAFVVLAPLLEETLFRGFLYPGLAASRLGATGAVVLSSLAWTVPHIQYDLYDLASVFVLGLLLGAARAVTGSLWVCLWIHGLVNLIATLEAGLAGVR